jgi:hypothetical protein
LAQQQTSKWLVLEKKLTGTFARKVFREIRLRFHGSKKALYEVALNYLHGLIFNLNYLQYSLSGVAQYVPIFVLSHFSVFLCIALYHSDGIPY